LFKEAVVDSKKELKRAWLVRLKDRELFCALCGELITAKKELTIEHDPPKSRQYELGKSDLLPAHKNGCNHYKGALEYSEYQLFLLLQRVRNGERNKSDLETLSKIREFIRSIGFGQREK
jgi:hypothetical protein